MPFSLFVRFLELFAYIPSIPLKSLSSHVFRIISSLFLYVLEGPWSLNVMFLMIAFTFAFQIVNPIPGQFENSIFILSPTMKMHIESSFFVQVPLLHLLLALLILFKEWLHELLVRSTSVSQDSWLAIDFPLFLKAVNWFLLHSLEHLVWDFHLLLTS